MAHVPALPPFVLGVNMPRYLAHPGSIAADLLALDAAGKPRAGIDMTVRLIKRDWNSVLQASDFTQGTAKYVTQEIDRTVEERHVTSTDAAQTLNFAASEAGIYVVEVTAADRLGRRQMLRVDCFMAGDTPVTWSRPPAKTVTLKTDKDDYAPGENATLLIESPFQAARALVVTEQPDGMFDYALGRRGERRRAVSARATQAGDAALPVHVLLMRDGWRDRRRRRPRRSIWASRRRWPRPSGSRCGRCSNRVNVAFDAPPSARPAQTVEVALRLSDEGGQPLAGEATFWMVDQAVLALAKEAPLDPLPNSSSSGRRAWSRATRATWRSASSRCRKTRAAARATKIPASRTSRSGAIFTPVPIYLPHVKIGPDGVAHVQVKLPDTLTVFMLRAEVDQRPGSVRLRHRPDAVRQPIVAQPVLPRFLRPGDTFDAEGARAGGRGPGRRRHGGAQPGRPDRHR